MGDFEPFQAIARIDLADEPGFELGGMTVLPAERAVLMNGARRELQPRVMQVLIALARARPQVVSRERLVELCWEGRVVGDDALNRCVLALRHLAQEFTPQPFTIKTVPRVGHRLVERGAGIAATATGRSRWRSPLAAALAALLLVAAAVFLIRSDRWPWKNGAPVPTVILTAAADDGASWELVRDLAVKVSSLQSAQPASMRLVIPTERPTEEPDLQLQVRRFNEQASIGASFVLTAVPSRAVLWSRELQQPSGSVADLKQQAAVAAARVLGCAAEALASESPLGETNLKAYLTACDGMSEAIDDSGSIVRMLERVVQSSPRFVDGWAKLLHAEFAALSNPSLPEDEALIPALRRHMVFARRLEPHLPEAYLGQYVLMSPADLVGRGRLLDTAIAHNPHHAELRVQRAIFLDSVGRTHDALQDARQAVKLDPLSPSAQEEYIVTLAIAGRMDVAQQELHVAERLWPGDRNVVNARYTLNLRWGDPREALRILRSEVGPRKMPNVHEPFLLARIDPSTKNIEAALRHGRLVLREVPGSISVYSQLLAQFDRNEELFNVLLNWQRMDLMIDVTDALFRPAFADIHRDRRFMQVAHHLGLLKYWRTTGEWPDFCYARDLPYDCKVEAAKIAPR